MDELFVKITNEQELHNGFQYSDGLNILDSNFNENCDDFYGSGGFYITSLKNINKYYYCGINLRIVELPLLDKNFKIVPVGDSWRVNMLIMKEKYSLYDKSTYDKFGLKMEDNDFIVDFASKNNNIKFFNDWTDHKLLLKYTINSIDDASILGNIDILNWWQESGLDLIYTSRAINYASANNQIRILNWWKCSNLKLLYTSEALDLASKNGHKETLDWWLKSGLTLKYTEKSMDWASMKNQYEVLDWWLNSGLTPRYSYEAMDYASWNGNITVLNWWIKSGLELKYTKNYYFWYNNDNKSNTNVLDWWCRSGLKIKFKHLQQ
ncbi:ankyrin repeat protein [Acanthamoeba polyphaga moumouvirus]|uniref:Ankyrin repeat protein n=1 Tax=Acanthamoeba polyphaga moumouvirus TaxID=1269028 RepID=L7RC08_9VIRU|nr:ankyrin repeat protein [Acanthamoeba polyphaga moumouvirus]AGC01721.1 ankyrin repeat protein [Acanthamoeba polyphaga moumouvirus]